MSLIDIPDDFGQGGANIGDGHVRLVDILKNHHDEIEALDVGADDPVARAAAATAQTTADGAVSVNTTQDTTIAANAATAATAAATAATAAATAATAAAAAQTTANGAVTVNTTQDTTIAANAATAAAASAAAASAAATAQTTADNAGIIRKATLADIEAYSGPAMDFRSADIRDELYADPASALTIDSITVLSRVGGGRIIRKCLSDLYWHQKTEFWYSASLGNNRAAGSFGAPIQTIGELERRLWRSRSTAPCTLYVDAALTNNESAAFGYLVASQPWRQWSIVNGAAPVTPSFLFDAANFDGSNNVGLTNNQDVSSSSWFNGGSRVGFDAVGSGSGMTFKSIASAGKLRDGPSIAFTGNGFFRTPVVPGLVNPITWIVVVRVTNGAAVNGIVGGRDGANDCGFLTNTQWRVFAGIQAVPSFSGLLVDPTSNTYNYLYGGFNEGQVLFALNGQPADSNDPVNGGSNTVTGVTIGAQGDGTSKLDGEIVLAIGLENIINAQDPHAFDQFIQYKLGSGFPQ